MVFYLLLLIYFYFIPWFIGYTEIAISVILVIIALIYLIISVYNGIRNGLVLGYILSVAIIFIPSIFIFHNLSARVYAVVYADVVLFGNLIALP